MNSGRIDVFLGAVILLSATGATGAADLNSLLNSLAREPPQEIAFVETNRSTLLEHDLVVSGVLEYPARGKLTRIVAEPYRERTDIEGGEVRIQREGRPERRFSLQRSAELGGLLSAFSALLAGDRAALEANFELTVEFQPGGWQIDLVPRQISRQDRVGRISVQGAGDEPTCIAVMKRDGAVATRILLGAAAEDTPPVGCDLAARED